MAEEGIAAEVEARAIKKVVVALLLQSGSTQTDLAQRLQTSRIQVRRLLDPENISITLDSLQRSADVAGHRLVLRFESLSKRTNPRTNTQRASTNRIAA